MTGALILSANPTQALQAATKQYADTFVSKAGGTMTGALILSADPTQTLEAATKRYVDNASGSTANYTVSSSNVTNATTGKLEKFVEAATTYQNITYSDIGYIIKTNLPTSWQEVSGGVTKTVTVSYDGSGTINTITVV
jgi:hypothetical protein